MKIPVCVMFIAYAYKSKKIYSIKFDKDKYLLFFGKIFIFLCLFMLFGIQNAMSENLIG